MNASFCTLKISLQLLQCKSDGFQFILPLQEWSVTGKEMWKWYWMLIVTTDWHWSDHLQGILLLIALVVIHSGEDTRKIKNIYILKFLCDGNEVCSRANPKPNLYFFFFSTNHLTNMCLVEQKLVNLRPSRLPFICATDQR